MSKELEALNRYQDLMQYLYDSFEISHDFKNEYAIINQALTELEELKCDVARYFELYEQAREKWGNGLDDVEAYEYTKLHVKLSKVGAKDV